MRTVMNVPMSMNAAGTPSLPIRRPSPSLTLPPPIPTEDGADDDGDEGLDDLPERASDDDGDREVDDVAAHEEVLESLEHEWCFPFSGVGSDPGRSTPQVRVG
jgi:hypothetical protein